MIDILLLVVVVLQIMILHNQRKAADPNTESFTLWMIQATVAVAWAVFLVWAYHQFIR